MDEGNIHYIVFLYFTRELAAVYSLHGVWISFAKSARAKLLNQLERQNKQVRFEFRGNDHHFGPKKLYTFA